MPDRTQDELAAYAASVKELEEWGAVYADRDSRIHRARKAGLSQAEVARRMGISRDAVIRAWGTDDESSEEGR
jgi:ribosome-binding protein aMBF1 (putative translation factor)